LVGLKLELQNSYNFLIHTLSVTYIHTDGHERLLELLRN
jgi:hypothetical protein